MLAGKAGATAGVDAIPSDFVLNGYRVSELHELCERHGIKVPSKATKAQMVAALGEARG
jgi:hypothetical protein